MAEIKSRARIPQKRVQVDAPVFQPAGPEEQRLYAEGEPIPKTTDEDIEARAGLQNKAFEDERYAKLKALSGMNREPQALSPRDPGYGAKDLKEQEEIPEDAMLNKEAKKSVMEDIEQGAKPSESPEDAKEKFKMQLGSAVEKGDISPEEIQEIIKRLGR